MSTSKQTSMVFNYGDTTYISINSFNNEFKMDIDNDVIPIITFCNQQFVNVVHYFNEYFEQHLDFLWLYIIDAEIRLINNKTYIKLKLTPEAYDLIKQNDNYAQYLAKDEQNVMIISL